MSKKTTLERAYLHINNGGLSFSIIERVDVRKDCYTLPSDWHNRGPIDISPAGVAAREAEIAGLPREDRYNRRWIFKIETNHFGATTQYSFPIVPVSVKWMVWALQRVLARMEAPQTLPTDGIEHAFQDKELYVEIVDGSPLERPPSKNVAAGSQQRDGKASSSE